MLLERNLGGASWWPPGVGGGLIIQQIQLSPEEGGHAPPLSSYPRPPWRTPAAHLCSGPGTSIVGLPPAHPPSGRPQHVSHLLHLSAALRSLRVHILMGSTSHSQMQPRSEGARILAGNTEFQIPVMVGPLKTVPFLPCLRQGNSEITQTRKFDESTN